MALAKMSELLAGQRAVGSFSVANLEMLQGAVAAAEETGVPVILQIAEGRLGTAPLHMIGPAMLAAARASSLPLAVHLDHGRTLECIEQALDLGFTSVMYDGSHLPLEENIRMTRRVRDMARARGADLEAEIGSVGRTEEGHAAPAVCADPEDC
ncbi:MAG TPA: class II fructose-bisphosphate aldolase, partial [Clostridia bacterium]|nr:class II fructose-bisphosphate aldolase [Clostridia bacterium]